MSWVLAIEAKLGLQPHTRINPFSVSNCRINDDEKYPLVVRNTTRKCAWMDSVFAVLSHKLISICKVLVYAVVFYVHQNGATMMCNYLE